MKRDSLTRLIARSFGVAEVIQPVLPSRFEPIGPVSLPDVADFESERATAPTEAISRAMRPAIERVEAVAPGRPAGLGAIQPAEVKTAEDAAPARPYAAGPPLPLPPTELHPVHKSSSRVFESGEAPDGAGGLKPLERQPGRAAGRAARDRIVARREPQKRTEPGFERRRIGNEISPAEIRVRTPERAVTATRTEPQAERVVRRAADSRGDEGSQEQKVTVHIGRIEVRAVLTPASEPARKHAGDSRQRLTLSEYLKQREKGSK